MANLMGGCAMEKTYLRFRLYQLARLHFKSKFTAFPGLTLLACAGLVFDIIDCGS